jgi:hypothetical protein
MWRWPRRRRTRSRGRSGRQPRRRGRAPHVARSADLLEDLSSFGLRESTCEWGVLSKIARALTVFGQHSLDLWNRLPQNGLPLNGVARIDVAFLLPSPKLMQGSTHHVSPQSLRDGGMVSAISTLGPIMRVRGTIRGRSDQLGWRQGTGPSTSLDNSGLHDMQPTLPRLACGFDCLVQVDERGDGDLLSARLSDDYGHVSGVDPLLQSGVTHPDQACSERSRDAASQLLFEMRPHCNDVAGIVRCLLRATQTYDVLEEELLALSGLHADSSCCTGYRSRSGGYEPFKWD